MQGWGDDHLHQFHIYGKDYDISYEGGIGFPDNPFRLMIGNFAFDAGDRFTYEYLKLLPVNLLSGDTGRHAPFWFCPEEGRQPSGTSTHGTPVGPGNEIFFLSDSADNLRELQFGMYPESIHVIDWFHITMRLTVLMQYAKGLQASYPETGSKVSSLLKVVNDTSGMAMLPLHWSILMSVLCTVRGLNSTMQT